MKPKLFLQLFIFLLLNGIAAGQESNLNHPWFVVDAGGGGAVSGNNLQLLGSIGQPILLSGTAGSFTLDGGYVPAAEAISGALSTLSLSITGQWNLLSLPSGAPALQRAKLFPTARSAAFGFDGQYKQTSALEPGKGYWLKFDSSEVFQIPGPPLVSDTVTALPRWNMIGALSSAIAVENVSPLSPLVIKSPFFGYNVKTGYYQVDSLQPGKGYWVRVNTAGQLYLRAAPKAVARPVSSARSIPPQGR